MKASKLVLWHRKKEDKITTDRCSDPLNIIDNMEYVSKKIMPESSDSFAAISLLIGTQIYEMNYEHANIWDT